jgi:hypothetical protein
MECVYARMRCRGYGRRSHEQQCAGYRDVSESNHRVLPFVQVDNIIAPVTVFSKQATAKFKSRHPDGTSAVSADEGLSRGDGRLRDYLAEHWAAHSDYCPPDATHVGGLAARLKRDRVVARSWTMNRTTNRVGMMMPARRTTPPEALAQSITAPIPTGAMPAIVVPAVLLSIENELRLLNNVKTISGFA